MAAPHRQHTEDRLAIAGHYEVSGHSVYAFSKENYTHSARVKAFHQCRPGMHWCSIATEVSKVYVDLYSASS